MVNNNRYKLKFLPAFSLKVYNDDYEKEFFICTEQLVSILYVEKISGKVKVARGRVKYFKSEIGRSLNSNTNNSDIILDTSEKHKSSEEKIPMTSVLEINPIDWRYPDIENATIPITFEDWYEMNKRVNAPSSYKEDRIDLSNKRNYKGRTL